MSTVIAINMFLKSCQFYLGKLSRVKYPLTHFYQWAQNKEGQADKGKQNVVVPGNPSRFHC